MPQVYRFFPTHFLRQQQAGEVALLLLAEGGNLGESEVLGRGAAGAGGGVCEVPKP